MTHRCNISTFAPTRVLPFGLHANQLRRIGSDVFAERTEAHPARTPERLLARLLRIGGDFLFALWTLGVLAFCIVIAAALVL